MGKENQSTIGWIPNFNVFGSLLQTRTLEKFLLPKHTLQRTKLTWRRCALAMLIKLVRSRLITRAKHETAQTIHETKSTLVKQDERRSSTLLQTSPRQSL